MFLLWFCHNVPCSTLIFIYYKNEKYIFLYFFNPHARLVLVFIINVWPVIGRKQSMNRKAWIKLWCCVIKKTLLAQLLYRHWFDITPAPDSHGMLWILLMSVSANITRQNKKFINGFELIKYPYILCTIIYMLAYILYFSLESKMIIVGLHIITSRHVFNTHISTSKVCILLGASKQTRYGEQWINTQRFRISEV